MDKVLNSIRELASANVQSNATQLGSFLGSTPIIRSCNEIDELLSVLVNRRSELQLSQLTGQLQLLQLFLEHAKQVKQSELAAANHQLACVEADLMSIGNSAVAAGVEAPNAAADDAFTPAGLHPVTGSSRHAPGNAEGHSGGLTRPPQGVLPRGGPAAAAAAAAAAAGLLPVGDITAPEGLDGLTANGAANLRSPEAAAHSHLVQSKEARMHAHFEDLQTQYLAQCGVGDAGGGPAEPPPGLPDGVRSGPPPGGKRGRTVAVVADGDASSRDAQHPMRLFSQEIETVYGQSCSSRGTDRGGASSRATAEVQRASDRLLNVGDVLQAATQYTELTSVLEMLPSQPGRQRAVTGIAFSCDGRILAKGGASMHIRLHNFDSVLSAGTRVHAPMAEIPVTTRVTELACSPLDPALLLSAGDCSGSVNLWDVSAVAAPGGMPRPPAVPTTTASARTGGPASTSSGSGGAATTTSASGAGVAAAPLRVFSGHSNRVWSLSFSALRPSVFVSGSDDCTVRLWDVKQHKHAWVADLNANVCSVAFSPWDEYTLACGTAAHSISIFDVRNNKTPISSVQGLGKTVAYVRFVSRTELVASSVNSSLSLWRWEPLERIRTFGGHVNVRNFVGMETSGDYIACGSETSQVHVFCKYLSRPILSHTLTPARMPPSTSYFTLATAWKPNSTYLLASLSTGSCHILSMGNDDA